MQFICYGSYGLFYLNAVHMLWVILFVLPECSSYVPGHTVFAVSANPITSHTVMLSSLKIQYLL